MTNEKFILESPFEPTGDQPQAIAELVKGLKEGKRSQVLLGVTGSGKTFTVANVVAQINKPTLVMAHNKTLAAQLYSEFKALFPKNAVEYFVSYYDYYQPEAYVPSKDLYIEKDSAVNEEIDKLRHSATRSLLERRDVLIVASVSCIYGLGSPKSYLAMMLVVKKGETLRRDDFLRRLVEMSYSRNDIDFTRGSFRVRGDTVDVFPAYEATRAIRVEFFGNEVVDIFELDPLRGSKIATLSTLAIFPASHHVTPLEQKKQAIRTIQAELRERLAELKQLNKLVEYQRLEQRTMLDIEMIDQLGFCPGVENYSRHMDGREAGSTPPTLLDYFPDDFLLVLDESHITVPQVGAMYRGDRARKINLVEHGFRLPCALDNRPLKFEEFEARTRQQVFVSATPADFELQQSGGEVVEQIVRPTGLLDPVIEMRPAREQVKDLMEECRKVAAKGQRVLATTLTKKMAEDLTDYFRNNGLRVRYMHSDVETLERIELLRDLRKGKYDILVGINLLREGLDLPEVTLVAILDADKEGFLRSRTSLIQTFGRAARNAEGRVIMYADRVTGSMQAAMDESARRRAVQEEYNKKHGITPKTVQRNAQNLVTDRLKEKVAMGQGDYLDDFELPKNEKGKEIKPEDLPKIIAKLENEMRQAARDLDFEGAAEIRDQLLQYREMELRFKGGGNKQVL